MSKKKKKSHDEDRILEVYSWDQSHSEPVGRKICKHVFIITDKGKVLLKKKRKKNETDDSVYLEDNINRTVWNYKGEACETDLIRLKQTDFNYPAWTDKKEKTNSCLIYFIFTF